MCKWKEKVLPFSNVKSSLKSLISISCIELDNAPNELQIPSLISWFGITPESKRCKYYNFNFHGVKIYSY